MFAAMDDPYFKERSADVKDVASRIIKHILELLLLIYQPSVKKVIIVAEDFNTISNSSIK